MLYLYILTAIQAILLAFLVGKFGDMRIELATLNQKINDIEVVSEIHDSYIRALEKRTLDFMSKSFLDKIGGTD